MKQDITTGTVVRYDGERAIVVEVLDAPPAWLSAEGDAAHAEVVLRFLDPAIDAAHREHAPITALEVLEPKACQHAARGTAAPCPLPTAPGEDVCPEHGGLPYDA